MAGGFDPKAYLAEGPQGGGFDPKAYLAEGSHDAPEADVGGAGQAALEHFGNAASMGYLPQWQAMAGKVLPNPSGDVDAKLRAQGFKINQPQESYVDARDANIKRMAQQSQEHPYASGAGTLAGIVGGGVLTSAALPAAGVATLGGGMIGPVTRGANLLNQAKYGAKIGALMGAVANPGDTEGEIDPLQVEARAKGAAIGGAVGGAVPVVVDGIKMSAEKLAEYLRTKAALKTTRALGRPTPTVADKMAKSGQDVAVGRELLDAGAIPVFGTPKRIADRVEALKEKAGQAVGDLLDRGEAEVAAQPKVQYTPVRFKKGSVQVQPEVRATPIRIDENPAKRAFPWLTDRDAPPIIVKGEEQPVQAALYEQGPHYETTGAVKTVPGTDLAGKIDAKKLANTIRQSSEFAAMKTTPGMESTVAAIEKQLSTLEGNGQMSLKEAQALRQGIDRSINFNKSAPDMRGAQEGLYQQRTALRDAMNEKINQLLPGAGKDALLKANRQYGNFAAASELLDRGVAQNQANRAVSLTDTIAAAGGAAHGSPAAALALGALNKAGRTFGNSMQARGYDAIAKGLPAVGRVAGAVGANPVLSQRFAQEIANPTKNEAAPPAFDEDTLGVFRANPALIDSIADPKMRSALQKSLGRAPSQAPMPDRKPSGEDRWANQGAQSAGVSDADAQRLMASPKGKSLLIQASDLKPGSRAMKAVQEQIQAHLKGAK